MSRWHPAADTHLSSTTTITKSASSNQLLRAPVPNAADQGVVSLLLTPFLLLAFGLLHAVYHLVLLARQAKIKITKAIARPPNRPVASFNSLDDLLTAHGCPPTAARVPIHLAVVIADAAPSSIRLYISTLFSQLDPRRAVPKLDPWSQFRSAYEAALQAKHANDIASMVHLARISGVQQLSIYTRQSLSPTTLQSLSRILQVEYKTSAVFTHQQRAQHHEVATQIEPNWSRYAELRRRRPSPSSTGSAASSDSEAGLSSLDETLASSYTAENEPDQMEAVVNIQLGLASDSGLKSATSTMSMTEKAAQPLHVALLSHSDAQHRFATILGEHIHKQVQTYCSDVVLPDINSTASAASSPQVSPCSLRKSWVSKRTALTSQLTVGQLDHTLAQAGYLAEPELLVVWGAKPRLRELYGFPAWPIRLTDLFYDPTLQPNRAYGSDDFVSALSKLAKTEQRYGK